MKIIPYVMTWDGIVTTYHKGYLKELYRIILKHTFSHMKKTLESVSFDYRRGIEERVDQGENMDTAVYH